MSQVTLYQDSDYRGTSRSFGVGRYNYTGISNDSLSSIRVPAGLKVILFEHGNFGGNRCVLVQDTPNMAGANDKISSFVVEELGTPQVIIYSDSDYRGWSVELPVGSYSGLGIGNDRLSSIIVPAGYRVTLYEDGPFKGRSLELNSSRANLGDFNDRATSAIVDNLPQRAPTLDELKQIIGKVGPLILFHPDDPFRPSSVEYFLNNATLVAKNGLVRPAASEPLPSGGGDDGEYWLVGNSSGKNGNLASAVSYVNAKFQNNWLDLQFWIFYPHNGGGALKVKVVLGSGVASSTVLNETMDLTPMGQHGGDWEHVTVRVDPVRQEVRALYLAQHDGGKWLSLGDIAFNNGGPIVYASKHGHASYRDEGDNLSNGYSDDWTVASVEGGLVNSCTGSLQVLDCKASGKTQILRADFLSAGITLPSWMSFARRWGPRVDYSSNELKDKIARWVGSIPYSGEVVNAIWNALPDEMKYENGPTGPWCKSAWSGSE